MNSFLGEHSNSYATLFSQYISLFHYHINLITFSKYLVESLVVGNKNAPKERILTPNRLCGTCLALYFSALGFDWIGKLAILRLVVDDVARISHEF